MKLPYGEPVKAVMLDDRPVIFVKENGLVSAVRYDDDSKSFVPFDDMVEAIIEGKLIPVSEALKIAEYLASK